MVVVIIIIIIITIMITTIVSFRRASAAACKFCVSPRRTPIHDMADFSSEFICLNKQEIACNMLCSVHVNDDLFVYEVRQARRPHLRLPGRPPPVRGAVLRGGPARPGGAEGGRRVEVASTGFHRRSLSSWLDQGVHTISEASWDSEADALAS